MLVFKHLDPCIFTMRGRFGVMMQRGLLKLLLLESGTVGVINNKAASWSAPCISITVMRWYSINVYLVCPCVREVKGAKTCLGKAGHGQDPVR